MFLLRLVSTLMMLTGSQSITLPPVAQGMAVQSRRAAELHQVVPKPTIRPIRLLNQALQRSPTATNMVFGAWILAVGDILAQVVIERGETNWARCGHSALLGFTWAGYCSPQVYRLADALFPGTTPLKLACKVCTSCGVLATSGNYVNMLGRRLLAGAPLSDAVSAVHRDFWEVVRADLAVWPAYDAVCFAAIPAHLRGVTTASVNCLWSAYISTVASGDKNAHSSTVGTAA